MKITILVEDCQYYLPYEKGWDYTDEGGDCDHIEGPSPCDPNKCPINQSLHRKASENEV